MDKFFWHGHDTRTLLPDDWEDQVRSVTLSRVRHLDRGRASTSRESDDVGKLRRGRVPGTAVRDELPWLDKLYRTTFLDMAEHLAGEPVSPAEDVRYGVVLNVAIGTDMRLECHVDSNPVEGLLFLTDHPRQAGGELVIGHNPEARSAAEVDADCSTIIPVAGHALFFRGSDNPHYVRFLKNNDDIRIVAAMNYYTETVPESSRPAEINQYLFGEE
ncbi:hypothetical protein GCM10010191_53700 [Actinomadura vinacea]|uniref:2OG-Fe(II) oxygenase n=1 Tax=Actinomadura vinacea TaxID=115336 RepID=A0ABN3JKC5_9ACTN